MLFSFGCITDVQHADVPDGASFGGIPRFYRSSLSGEKETVENEYVGLERLCSRLATGCLTLLQLNNPPSPFHPALRRAVDDWLAQPPRFVVQLGDIIDGKAVGHSERALRAVLREFGRLRQMCVRVQRGLGWGVLVNATHVPSPARAPCLR